MGVGRAAYHDLDLAAGAVQFRQSICHGFSHAVSGFELADIARITRVTTVPGRMEWVSQQPAVLVDYAHTADGLQACLSAARARARAIVGGVWRRR